MDAHAHLLSLGWAGPGHSLDSRPSLQHKGRRGLAYDPSQNNHTGRGLVKPLLVSQKNNSFGIGKKAYEPAAGNEWWLKGFENALSNIGKNSNSEATSGATTPGTGNTSSYRGKHNGLYGFFVKGQQMEGTIQESAKGQGRGRKRKSDALDQEEDTSTSSANHTPGSTVSIKTFASKSEATTDFQQISQFLDVRDKDRKQGMRRVKTSPIREFEQVGNFFKAGSERKQQCTPKIEDGNGPVASQGLDKVDVEEIKKERRQRRKEARLQGTEVPLDMAKKEQRTQGRKAAKVMARLSSINKKTFPSDPIEGAQIARVHADSSASGDEALRRAERKRRKEQKRLAKAQAAS
ncbi:hypothetical protein EPUS_01035 [Endocarpon pusillum Z07020]|uniref:G-patch domain-containing protein n=1 Tax=Endocarpon pusillum (strain Z07020 / HMAS-L-300199) TaxID=1263415 RepID=U1HJH9_ENDPU|nr:uncharacterized protein EPUS_01035 [Endocarpon pusillum Z07020]ERF69079.1 hypothetical protein EPUS_01035 [Endocarpon pusillum Z07020]